MFVDTGFNTIILFGLIILLSALVSFYISGKDPYCPSIPLAKILIYICCFLIASVLISLAYFLINREFPSLLPSAHGSALTLMDMALSALFIQILCITGRDRAHAHGAESAFENPASLLSFELSIILILFFCMGSSPLIHVLSEQSRYFPYFFFVFLAACLVDLLSVFQTERRRVIRRVTETRKEATLNQLYYENIRERRAEMKRIRGEYDSELKQIASLLKENRTKEAADVLQNLSGRIEATKEYPFCGIPVVNAVLTEKSNQCQENRISLVADLLFPDRLSIQDLDLCMAFGNLLDNAIRECEKSQLPMDASCGAEITMDAGCKSEVLMDVNRKPMIPKDTDGRPEISLTGRIRHGYLIIKCQNPCFSEKGMVPEGTGYGLKILKDLAERYNGDFRSETDGQTYTAQLSLLLQNEMKREKAS